MTARTAPPADLIITGRVATLAGPAGFGWAEALAVRDGEIVATGTAADVSSLATSATRQWHLGAGAIVMPGLIDAHLHLATAGMEARQIDLSTAETIQAALAIVASVHEERTRGGDSSSWLLGHGWSPDRWGVWPTAHDLEAAAPGRRAALWSHDHHSRLVSLAAMRAMGVDRTSEDPPAGALRRAEDGEPTGVLHERAANLADSAVPEPTVAEFEDAIAAYASELPRLGVVGCHDPGWLAPDPEMRLVAAYRGLAERGKLPLHVRVSLRSEQLPRAIEERLESGAALVDDGPRRTRLRLGWLKLFADGALGSRTAALFDPYEDGPPATSDGATSSGLLLLEPGELDPLLDAAERAGIACQVHAIGDRAVRVALDAFERLGDARLAISRRIEHAQLVAPADIDRFRSLGVAASVQPLHIRSDAGPARRAWGERSRHAFPLRALDQAGSLIPLGSDAPVEPPDPWPGIALAVHRRAHVWPAAAPAFHPEQAIGLERALRAATVDPARAAADRRGGRLLPGRRADLIVMPARVVDAGDDPAAIATARPLATLVGGEVAHLDGTFDP